jgi:hypothetical protein
MKDLQTAILSWSTIQESNSAYYEVQRSNDETNFTSIGQVSAHAYSTIKQAYTFTDEHPLNGINYYRLKEVDASGLSTFTKTISLNFDNAANIIVNTLILNNNIKVSYNGTQTTAQLLNATGQLCGQYTLKAGENILPVQSASTGIYYLLVNEKVYKLIK